MPGGTKVADLFSLFGFKMDPKSWNAGEKRMADFAQRVGDGVLSVGKVVAAVGVAAVAVGGTMLANMVLGVADLGDKLDEMAQKTGVSVETLQELGYAAGQAGVSQDDLGASLGKLERNMAAAAHGGKSQATAFRRMGISVKNADGTLRDAGDVFGDMADHFSSMPDGAEKTAQAMAVLGRGGANMIPVLNNGRAKLEALRQEFVDTGAEIDGPTAAAFGNFNDQKDLFKAGLQGIKVQLATALLPTLLGLVKSMNAWFKANRGLIRQRVAQFAKVLVAVLKGLAWFGARVVDVVTGLTGGFDQLSGVMKVVTIVVGILGAAMVAAGIAAAIAWIAGLWPFALLVLAIAAVILIVEDIWEAFNGGDSVFGRLWESIKKYIGEGATGTLVEAFGIWLDTMKVFFDFAKAGWDVFVMEVKLVIKVIEMVIKRIEDAAKAAAKAAGWVQDLGQDVADRVAGRTHSLLPQGATATSPPSATAALDPLMLSGTPLATSAPTAAPLTNFFARLLGPQAPAAPSQITTTVTVNAIPGMSEAQLAAELDKKLRERDEAMAAGIDAAAGVGQEDGWAGQR